MRPKFSLSTKFYCIRIVHPYHCNLTFPISFYEYNEWCGMRKGLGYDYTDPLPKTYATHHSHNSPKTTTFQTPLFRDRYHSIRAPSPTDAFIAKYTSSIEPGSLLLIIISMILRIFIYILQQLTSYFSRWQLYTTTTWTNANNTTINQWLRAN